MVLTHRIFLKLIGLIYLIAFVSLWSQVEGLLGGNGILPVEGFLKAVKEQVGSQGYRLVPTLLWINSSDLALRLLCAGGVFFSVCLILGILPVPCLFLLWAFYLSLASVAQEFLSFQWDTLLLEVGFLSTFLGSSPSRTVVWLFRWLLFRLIFSSGVVKLSSGDPTWWNLTALAFHYETQPLPTWVGWYIHQMPFIFHRVSAGLTFVAELVVPFLFFTPRRLRRIGCVVSIGFQILILSTGNYCFFNLLAIALCLLLLGDGRGREAERKHRWPGWLVAPLAAVTLLVGSMHLVWAFRLSLPWPAPLEALAHAVAPFRTINGYGLFAVMTTWRPEIVVEGSRDGVSWLAYGFKYKPGDLKGRPGFVAPHQPRLDWQLWFAALSHYQHNRWFLNFCVRLLEGSPEVLRLLKKNPFPEAPPTYIRALLYEYRFTDFPTRRATGNWWRREFKGLYCPVLSLKENA